MSDDHIETKQPPPDGRIWRHKKTGGIYQVLCAAVRESDGVPVTIYKAVDKNTIWCRPTSEFYDGRFEEWKTPNDPAEVDPQRWGPREAVAALIEEESSKPINRWPFAESPGDFAKRLETALAGYLPQMPKSDAFVAAVHHVLIEHPPAFAPWVLESQKPPQTKAEKPIRTENIRPPIPIRTFDWSACRDGYEPGDPIGYGETEAKAIETLKWAEEERL